MQFNIRLLALASVFAVLLDQSASAQQVSIGDMTSTPMVFYLARGETDACGPGCSEWIAAEGQFDKQAPSRLQAFLAHTRADKLPIFFQSGGGSGDASYAVGRLLHERGMTAGVGRTLPEECKQIDDKTCDVLKQSGRPLNAELGALGFCASACVFALVGAKTRLVPPGARVGVHSGKFVRISRLAAGTIRPGKPETEDEKKRAQGTNDEARKYVIEMGIDARLMEIALKVPSDAIYYLNRDEIAEFGIDTREFLETRWLVSKTEPVRVAKFFVETKDTDRKQYRLSSMELACTASKRVAIRYLRGQAPGENLTWTRYSLFANDRQVPFLGPVAVLKADAIDSGRSAEGWGRTESFDFVDAMAKRDFFGIVTNAIGSSAKEPPKAIKLSTAGLSQGIAALRRKCGDAWSVPPPKL